MIELEKGDIMLSSMERGDRSCLNAIKPEVGHNVAVYESNSFRWSGMCVGFSFSTHASSWRRDVLFRRKICATIEGIVSCVGSHMTLWVTNFDIPIEIGKIGMDILREIDIAYDPQIPPNNPILGYPMPI